MFFGRKKHIKILADKFNHTISFDRNSIIITNNINFINVTDIDKNNVVIRYNIDSGETELSVIDIDLMDVLFEILRRNKLYIIDIKQGSLLTLDDYIDVEGKYAKDQIKQIKTSKKDETITNRLLGGNRIEAEVYCDLFILTDDLMVYRTNTIDIDSIKL